MKKLFLIRHAKSSWSDETLSDFERPLNKRGKKNIPLMASILKEKEVLPDCILSSPALRAKKTAKLLVKGIGLTQPILYDKTLYEADKEEIHKAIVSMDESCNTLFVVGHNPGLNDIAKHYVGFEQNIVTCGIVEIVFEVNKWKDITPKAAKLLSFEFPKKYAQDKRD